MTKSMQYTSQQQTKKPAYGLTASQLKHTTSGSTRKPTALRGIYRRGI